MTGGEVSIRENGQVSVLKTDAVDGAVRVDLDEDVPEVSVPADTRVSYSGEDALATDGGQHFATRARVFESRGWTLNEDASNILSIVSVIAIATGGWLFGTSMELSGILLIALGAGAAYVGARSKWSGSVEVDDDE